MNRMPNWVYAILIALAVSGIILVITTPNEPEPFTNKPVQTVEVKFYQERATRISLGRDAEIRLAVSTGKYTGAEAIPVICPRGFNPNPEKEYTVEAFDMRDETGRSLLNPVWILRNKTEDVVPMMEQIPNVGSFVFKK